MLLPTSRPGLVTISLKTLSFFCFCVVIIVLVVSAYNGLLFALSRDLLPSIGKVAFI